MIEGELLKLSVEEFSGIQRYMMIAGKNSEVYKATPFSELCTQWKMADKDFKLNI